MYVTTKKLKKCKKMLKAWSKDHFRNVVQRIKRTKELLWKVEEFSTRTGCWDEVERLKSELSSLCDKEEKKCGSKGHTFSGYKMGTKIQNSSMVLLPKENIGIF